MLIKRWIVNNVSLVIILLGAISNFVLILYIRKELPEIFGTLSLYLTYLGIVGNFGFIGFDQVYLRLTNLDYSKPSIGKNVFIILMILMLLIPIAFAGYFSKYENLGFWHLYFSGVALNAIILGYNTQRLQQNFTLAQLFKNSYKVLFLIGVGLLFIVFKNTIAIDLLFQYAAVILTIFGSIALISFIKNNHIEEKYNTRILLLAISFVLNIGLITLLGYGERILIEEKIDTKSFELYFYYLTIFLFPLTLLQEYVGFKELVYFKSKVDKKKVYYKVFQLFALGILTYLGILIVVWMDKGKFLDVDLSRDSVLILWMSLLGITKLIYGLFSAILGAKGDSKSINKINFVTILILFGSWSVLYWTGYTLNRIILSLILVFLYRSTHTYFLYVR